jgi:hypothetical protein
MEIDADQNSTAFRIIVSPTTLLMDDCGFGKTVVILGAAAGFALHGGKTLIVSDPEPAKGTWAKEHLKWEHTKHLRVIVLAGTTPARRKVLVQQEADVYVVNYHILKWMVANNIHNFALVAADEANCLRDVKSVWRGHLSTLSKTAISRIAATATLMSSSVADYWGICRWADRGATFGKTVDGFRAAYCYQKPTKQWGIRNKVSEQAVREKMLPLCVQHTLKTSATIPIKTIYIERELSARSMSIYEEFIRIGEEALGLTQLDDDKPPMSKMMLANKLSCLTSGFIYSEILGQITHHDLMYSTNLARLMEDTTSREAIPVFDDREDLFMSSLKKIESRHGKGRIVIVYWFKHELEQLQRILPTGITDKECSDERWNSGKDEYMFAQYNRSAKGRNWQENCNVMIAYSQAFHFVQVYQIIRRLARQGQKKESVYLYVLHFNNTLDDRKRQVIKERLESHDTMSALAIESTQKRK